MFKKLLKNIPSMKKKMLSSLKEMATTIFQKKNISSKETLSNYKKYHSIQYLPVDNFNNIIKSGRDYRYLLKIDDYEYLPDLPELELLELEKIWEKIEEEYLQEDKQKKQEVEFELSKKILEMQNQYMIINSFVFLAGFNEEFADKLTELGYEIDKTKPLHQELDRIQKSTGLLLTKLRIKQKELERYQVMNQEPMEFEDIVDIIERHKGHYLNTKELTVKRWISIKNNFIKYTKEQENARRSNKTR